MHVIIHVYDVLDQWHMRLLVHDDQAEDWAEPTLKRTATWPIAPGRLSAVDLLAEIGENVLEAAYAGPNLTGI